MRGVLFCFFLFFLAFPSLAAAPLPCENELDEVQRLAFRYFWENCHPQQGLILDRQHNHRPPSLAYSPSSVAAVGFGLTALAIGAKRGWIPWNRARERALVTLRTMQNRGESVRGFYYHFVDPVTGRRAWNCEVSSIDTALFLAGALTAGSCFGGEVETLAQKLYRRVEWPWMLDSDGILRMGWTPEQGFQSGRWQAYDEASILYIMAIASPTHPISPASWRKVRRAPVSYHGRVSLASGPLFTHQYSHLWIDFRGINDGIADYWQSSVNAVEANRLFCLHHGRDFETYRLGLWGLTASDGPKGYEAYSAPPGRARHDGTIAPTAALGSCQFQPDPACEALSRFKQVPGLWGRYGFSDAVNLDRKWISSDVIGIDQGAILLSIENARTGMIWTLFSHRPEIRKGLKRIGFRRGRFTMMPVAEVPPASLKFRSQRPEIRIPRASHPPGGDTDSEKLRHTAPEVLLDQSCLESGRLKNSQDAGARVRFLWDETNLYLRAEVTDDRITTGALGADMVNDDGLELFIDTDDNGFDWGSPRDFQIGLSPGLAGGMWAWTRKEDPRTHGASVRVELRSDGYRLEAIIPWSYLGIKPTVGTRFGLSIALRDVDERGAMPTKLNWFFLEPGILLGEAELVRQPLFRTGSDAQLSLSLANTNHTQTVYDRNCPSILVRTVVVAELLNFPRAGGSFLVVSGDFTETSIYLRRSPEFSSSLARTCK